MKHLVVAPLFALMLAALAIVTPVSAQDATPAPVASGTPIAPGPELCTLTPPTYEEVVSIAASPAAEAVAAAQGTPTIALPAGDSVDEATRQAVEQSMIVNVACLNTGSTLLAMAAYTDHGLSVLIGGAGPVSQELYDSLATPEAIAEDQWTVIVEFQEMAMLPDGRIAAIIVGDDRSDQSTPAGPTLFYLAEEGGHWYIDDFVNP